MFRPSTIPVTSSMRSASVDLPWSMWAMMQKFRMRAGSVAAGVVTVLPSSHAARSGRATAAGARPPGCAPVCAGSQDAGWGLRPDAGILADRSAGALPWKYGARTHCQKYSLLRDTRGSRVANIKSQIKRIRTNEKARQRNVAVRSALKTAVRRVRTAAESGDAAAAATALQVAAKRSTRPPARASSTRTRPPTASRVWPSRSPASEPALRALRRGRERAPSPFGTGARRVPGDPVCVSRRPAVGRSARSPAQRPARARLPRPVSARIVTIRRTARSSA